jgi:two-component system sensor histidine kinase KdpD
MPNRLKGRVVNLAVPDGLPPVNIDFALMMQALLNLIDNAVKYTPQAKPIDIKAYQEGQTVVVAVKDQGPGLPEAALDQVFNKFIRLNNTGAGGIGLGLSIAKGIVEAHNGRIWAKNRPGGGAIFAIALPVAAV